MTAPAPRPFLILTLRRTGGTSLMSFLGRCSAFPTVQHEPLNRDRLWGAVTRDFAATGDATTMTAALGTLLEPRPNIKHCIEIVPPEITRALIEQAAARDYAIFVQTRRDEAGRIASLLIALSTGAWGPEQAAKVYPQILDGSRKARPVELAKLPGLVRKDAAALGQTLVMLRNRGLTPDWLVFEELYKGATPVADQARALAAGLGMEVPADDPRLEAFAARGAQGSDRIEPLVPGMAEARSRLARLVVV